MDHNGFYYDDEELRTIPWVRTFQVLNYPNIKRKSEFVYTHCVIMHFDRFNKISHICMGFYKNEIIAQSALKDFDSLNSKNKHLTFTIEKVIMI